MGEVAASGGRKGKTFTQTGVGVVNMYLVKSCLPPSRDVLTRLGYQQLDVCNDCVCINNTG